MFRKILAVSLFSLVALVLVDASLGQTPVLPEPVADPFVDEAAPVDYQSCCCTSCCKKGCRGHHGGSRGAHCPVQMPPHYPYFPPMHGYYYFRPYHHSHLLTQQAIVTGWGGDPRAPYANEIFQQVYEEYKAAQ